MDLPKCLRTSKGDIIEELNELSEPDRADILNECLKVVNVKDEEDVMVASRECVCEKLDELQAKLRL